MSETKSYGYCRVSTARQAKEGISLDDQKRLIPEYCTRTGLPVPILLVDPGKTTKVPFADRAGGAALIDVVKPGDHIIMTRIDRGFRNVTDFLHWFDNWNARGIFIHIISFGGNTLDPRTPMGKAMFRMLAVMAEWERDLISERTREAHASFRERGLSMNGRVKTGFKAEKVKGGGFRAVPNVEMRKWMSLLLEMWQVKKLSQTQIANRINKYGPHSPTNKGGTLLQSDVSQYINTELRLREKEGRLPNAEATD